MLSEMFNGELFDGEVVTLAEMMRARELRSARQLSFLKAIPHASLLSVTMNIPGDIKNSQRLEALAKAMCDLIQVELNNDSIYKEEYLSLKTGIEYYCLVELSAKSLKEKMIALEQKTALGRLMDLDVLYLESDHIKAVSRVELGFQTRRCFLCQEDAKICGRSRNHTISEMRVAISEMLSYL